MNLALVIYLINILSVLRSISLFIMLISFGIMMFNIIEYGADFSRLKFIKKIIITSIVSMIVLVVVPKREDMYLIAVSTQINTENYNWTKSEVKELVDYTVKSIKEVKGEDKND